MYTKKVLNSLGTHCVRRTNTGSSFRCALTRPARTSSHFLGYTMQTSDTALAAISRPLSQQLLIWLLLAACITTLLQEDGLAFTAMHFYVQIIQLYIYCITHWNWNPFLFLSFPLFLSLLYTHVYIYICFLAHYIHLLRFYFTNFQVKCYIYPKISFKRGRM